MGARAVWRTLEAMPPSLPPPPPSPPTPPQAAAPPDPPAVMRECHAYIGLGFGDAYPVAFQEPCRLTAGDCCALAHDHNHTAAFHLSPSGCCTLLEVPEADWGGLSTQGVRPQVDGNATRPVVQVSGARNRLPLSYREGAPSDWSSGL